MRVKISFHIKAEAVSQSAKTAEAGAGSAGGKLFEVQFYEFQKDLKPAGFRFYMNRLTKLMAGFSKAMDVLNNFRKMEG
jgi:hypothetical protein